MNWGKKLSTSFFCGSLGMSKGCCLAPKSLPTQDDARSHHHNTTHVLAESWGGCSRRNATTEHVCHPPRAAGSLTLGTSFLFGCLLLCPTEHFCRGPSLCSLPSSSWAETWTPQSCLLHTAGEDWSYMEKLVMKAVLGNSTSKVASRDSLARLTILLVITVWANRDVTLQSTWRL